MCRLPLLVAIAAVAGVLGVAEGAVDCPQPATQKMFNADLYLGSWYEMKRVPRDYEDDGQCGMATYSWLDSSKTAVNVLNTNYIPKSMAVSSVVLRADPDDLPNGKLKVSFPNFPQITSNYWVLGTDYTTYAVVYSCAAAAPSATVPHITLWVLARDPSKYTEETDKKVMKLIESNGLDASILKTVEHHKGCPEAVCKPCASPKPNLDLAKLKSRWAVVQHSPFATDSDKQSCSLAEFTANADGLHFNTTTYQATSAEAGADKSSKLDAKWTDANKKDGSFEISAGTGPGKMCVLGTDYDNWAVVSVCLPPAPFTTAAPLGPVSVPTPAVSGGVYVLSRKRGLTPAQQMDANKCVVNAGIPAASMQTVAATPCPALALEDNTGSSAAGVTMTPAVLIASLLAAALGHLSSKQ